MRNLAILCLAACIGTLGLLRAELAEEPFSVELADPFDQLDLQTLGINSGVPYMTATATTRQMIPHGHDVFFDIVRSNRGFFNNQTFFTVRQGGFYLIIYAAATTSNLGELALFVNSDRVQQSDSIRVGSNQLGLAHIGLNLRAGDAVSLRAISVGDLNLRPFAGGKVAFLCLVKLR